MPHRLMLWNAASLLLLMGCHKASPLPSVPVASVAAAQLQAAVGKECTLEVITGTNSPSTTYHGTVSNCDDDHIVLTDALLVVRNESPVPVLGHLPWVGHRFRNVGIALQELPESIVLETTNVVSLTVVGHGSSEPIDANADDREP